MKFNNIFLCMVTVFFTQLSQSMDNLVLAGNKVIAWDVILVHDKSLFSHNMIRSLAVNREFERRLCKTAKERRQYCVSLVSNVLHKNILEISGKWHKYGTSCGKTDHTFLSISDSKKKSLVFERLDLIDGKIRYARAWLDDFYGFSLCSRNGFFNDEDDFCCRGYDKVCVSDEDRKNNMIQYCLSSDGAIKTLPCVAKID